MNQAKVAYLILAHTDAAHLERLVKAINYQARIFIHLDQKSPIEDFSQIKLPSSAEFIKKRVRVAWGGISIIQATLYLIEAALDSGENFSHLVLLSGQDYPIKPSWMIHDFLNKNSDRQFIRLIDMTKSPNHHMKRIMNYWFWEPFFPFLPFAVDRFIRISMLKLFQKLRPVIYKKPLKGIIPAFGSQWWAITADCAAYILQFLADNPRFFQFYQYSHAPDEHFFHTLVANSPYFKQTDGFEDCQHCGPHRLPNLHIIHKTLNKIHTEADFEDIKLSEKFFIRKVISSTSDKLVDLINKEILLID